MKLYVKNTLSGLQPLYDSDYSEKKKLKIGQVYLVEIKHPRNILFHKKFFALLNLCYENYETQMPFESFRRWITIKAGYFNAYETDKGVFYDAQSIAFGSMNQIEFEEVYSRVLDVVIKLLHVTEEDINSEIMSFM